MTDTLFEQLGGTYTQTGDYLLPDLSLPAEKDNRSIGIWGQRRLRHLKQYHKQPLCFQGQVPVAQMVVAHYGIAAVSFHTENCHCSSLLCCGFVTQQKRVFKGKGINTLPRQSHAPKAACCKAFSCSTA